MRAKLRLPGGGQINRDGLRGNALSGKHHVEFRAAPPAQRITIIDMRLGAQRQTIDERLPAGEARVLDARLVFAVGRCGEADARIRSGIVALRETHALRIEHFEPGLER